jgi:hypothetical protein
LASQWQLAQIPAKYQEAICLQVKALKQYGKEVEDRWEHIAKLVPGQNKTSCFRRFKQLRQSVRANKS